MGGAADEDRLSAFRNTELSSSYAAADRAACIRVPD